MRGRLCICTWLLVLHAGVGTALAQSAVTIINPSEARTQWTHDGVGLQYFDYWVDNQPRPELGAYEKIDATTYRHKLPGDLAVGGHTVQVRACNLSATTTAKCSEWAVISFTVDKPGTPTVILPPGAPTNVTIITIAVPATERTKKTP